MCLDPLDRMNLKRQIQDYLSSGSEFRAATGELPAPVHRNLLAETLAVICLVALFGTRTSFAQNTASTGVAINANVIQGLTLTLSGGPLSLGTIVAGTTPAAIDPQKSSVLFTVAGNGGSAVKVSYSNVTLNGPSGATLTFTPNVYGSSSLTAQGASTSVSSGTTVNLRGSSGSEGDFYLWLGGNLSAVPAGQTTGSYSGTFTMTVSY